MLFFVAPGQAEIGLVFLLAFLLVLLLSLLVRARFNWLIKSSMTVLGGMFLIFTYFSIIGMQGWPTYDEMPRQAMVLWGQVNPPNKSEGFKGEIYLWLLHAEDDMIITEIPRAYVIPYSKKTHEAVEAAIEKIKNGEKVGIGFEGEDGGEGDGKAGSSGDSKTDSERLTDADGNRKDADGTNAYQFYEFPEPTMPSKPGS